MNLSTIDLINELEPELSKILNFIHAIKVQITKRNEKFNLDITCFYKFNDQSQETNFTTFFYFIVENGSITKTKEQIVETVIAEAKKREEYYKSLNAPPQNTTFSL